MPPKVNVNVELQNHHKLILEIKIDLLNKATSSKLDELLLEIRAKDVKTEILESQVAVLQNTVKLLSAKCDSNDIVVEFHFELIIYRYLLTMKTRQLMMFWLRLGIYSTSASCR